MLSQKRLIMKNSAFVKPTKGSLIAGIIVSVLMFLFGLFFLSLLTEEASQVGIVFMIFWLIVMLVIGGSFTYNLINYEKNSASMAAEEIVLPDSFLPENKTADFDERLRKTEKLKNEGLISEEEYAAKRREIMQEKW